MDQDFTYDVVNAETGEILMEGISVAAGAVIWASERGWSILKIESPGDLGFQTWNDSRKLEGYPEIQKLVVYVSR